MPGMQAYLKEYYPDTYSNKEKYKYSYKDLFDGTDLDLLLTPNIDYQPELNSFAHKAGLPETIVDFNTLWEQMNDG